MAQNGMDSPVFLLQLGIAAAVILLIAVATARFALRAGRNGAEPIIKATSRQLKQGWYQIDISVANRAPYRLVVDELRRVRPRSARLMAPIKEERTRQGDFQVWSDPATDKATTRIPLDLAIAPHEGPHGGVFPGSAEAEITAWVFMPEDKDPSELMLELSLFDREETLRCLRFGVVREPGPVRRQD